MNIDDLKWEKVNELGPLKLVRGILITDKATIEITPDEEGDYGLVIDKTGMVEIVEK